MALCKRPPSQTCESLEGHVVGGAAEPNRGRCALTCNGDERDPSPPARQLPSPRNLLRQFYLVALVFRKSPRRCYTSSITSLTGQTAAEVFQVNWKVCHSFCACAPARVCVYLILMGLPLSATQQLQRCHRDSVIIGRDRRRGSLAKTNQMGRNRGKGNNSAGLTEKSSSAETRSLLFP